MATMGQPRVTGRFGAVLHWMLVSTALSLALLWCCHGLLDGDPQLTGRRDVYRYFGPAYYFTDRALQAGEFPEWNPLTMGGVPFSATIQVSASYPPNLLRSWLASPVTPLSSETSVWWLQALHVVWLGLGVYLLARRRGMGAAAGVTAGLTSMTSAVVMRRLVEWNFLYTSPWIPWLWLGLEAVLEPAPAWQRMRRALLLALAAGLCVLGGFAQIFPYIVAASLLYAIAHELSARPPWRGAHGPRERLLRLLPLALAGLLAVALALPALLPALEYMQFSPRVAGSGMQAGGWGGDGQSLQFWLRSVAVWGTPRFSAEAVRGAGLAALCLALLGTLFGGLRRGLPLTLVLLACLDLGVGPPFPLSRFVEANAPFQMVARARVFDIAIVALGPLAGLGVQALMEPASARRRACMALVASLVLLWGGWLIQDTVSVPRYYLPTQAAMVWLPLTLLAPATALLLEGRGARHVAWLFPLLVAGEAALWAHSYVPYATQVRASDRAVLERAKQTGSEPFWDDNHRGYARTGNSNLYFLKAAITGYDPVYPSHSRDVIADAGRQQEYHRVVTRNEVFKRNSRGLQLFKRQLWLVDQVVQGPLPERARWFPPARVAFVQDATGLPASLLTSIEAVPQSPLAEPTEPLVLRPKCEKARRLRHESGRARRCIVDVRQGPALHSALRLRYRGGGPGARIESWVRDPATRSYQPALQHQTQADRSGGSLWVPLHDHRRLRIRLELVAARKRDIPVLESVEFLSDRADLDARLRIEARGPDSLWVRVDNAGTRARYLVVLDADYPGWSARVDGTPTRLWRTNDGFKGLVVPPGEHRVELRFESAPWRRGVAIALLAALLMLGLWLLLGRLGSAARRG